MKRNHIEPASDFAGLRVKVMQAGPGEYVAAIETEDGEELERSPRYLPTPGDAVMQAIERIKARRSEEREAHQRKEASE